MTRQQRPPELLLDRPRQRHRCARAAIRVLAAVAGVEHVLQGLCARCWGRTGCCGCSRATRASSR